MILHPWAEQVGRGLKVAVAGLAFAVAGLVVAAAVAAQEPEDGVAPSPAAVPAIDGYWPVERPLARPDMGDLETIRFITEDDYPPFNYLDSTGVLVGFNIDIAWGICTALKVRCTVRRVEWGAMDRELDEGRADAAIASHRISETNRERFLFTDRYYDTPARFVMRKDTEAREITIRSFVRKPVAVVRGTAHEAYLGAFFPLADVRPFDDRNAAREALRTGAVTALFGDAVSLAFWLDGTASHGCCQFVGGAYGETKFFGNGVGMAVKSGNYRLAHILNYGLDQMRRSGLYSELWQRHFPKALF